MSAPHVPCSDNGGLGGSSSCTTQCWRSQFLGGEQQHTLQVSTCVGVFAGGAKHKEQARRSKAGDDDRRKSTAVPANQEADTGLKLQLAACNRSLTLCQSRCFLGLGGWVGGTPYLLELGSMPLSHRSHMIHLSTLFFCLQLTKNQSTQAYSHCTKRGVTAEVAKSSIVDRPCACRQ